MAHDALPRRHLRVPFFRALLAAACLILAMHAAGAQPRQQTVRLGVLAFTDVPSTIMQWDAVVRHLNQRLQGYHVSPIYLDLDGVRQAVENGTVDFVLTNPGQYIGLEADHGVSRIATLSQAGSPVADQAVGGTVIALAGRDDLRSLADLRGQRLAASASEGFGGYQVVWRELADLGIDPARDLRAPLFVGFPMLSVVQAVEQGRADAGILRTCLLETLPGWEATFKVLSARPESALDCAVSTRLYPDWPMARLGHTPEVLAKAVAVALLQMPVTDQGLSWSVPADYQSVHALFRELAIGPYAYLREPGLMALAQRYWPALALLGLGVLGWLLYTLRVEHLVQQRTQALRHALRERERMAQRMRANQEQADHLSRLSVLGELSGTLAHELNQPLAGIGNYAQSLLRRLQNGRLTDDAVGQASTEIAALAQSAADILARIRGFARKRAALREVRCLHALALDAVALFQGMLAQAPQVTVQTLSPGSWNASVDPLQIQQVLLNFLKNGLDAMRELPHAEQRMTVTLAAGAGAIRLSVRDYGAGLAPQARERLFDAFFTTKTDGLGLGLSICMRIAEAHGGQLQAQPPETGPGMVFTLVVPRHD